MDETPTVPPSATSRRSVLGGAAVIGAGAVLAACGGIEAETSTSGAAMSAATSGSGSGASVGKASDVPVGSGIIVASAKAVVTQPTAGTFKAFNYTCTHKGCPVSKVSGDTIMCMCHGSEFSTVDGSVKHGPAAVPLAPLKVTDKNGELFVQD